MSAIFGIEEHSAQGFLDKSIICYPRSADGKSDMHSIVSAIRNEDLVFIKHCMPESSLHIKAVGVVRSDYPTGSGPGVCLPVEWVWRGEKILDNLDEVLSLCGSELYEEHNIMVQRAIINLLPEKYKLPQEK
ncbi:MAG: hypothetical protein OEV23_07020 [Gallionella sp.]|nr:hypothetical protein [Gallionella sp.]